MTAASWSRCCSAGLGALVVLALVFGSLLAGLPLLVGGVSILGTFLALLGLTELTEVSSSCSSWSR